MGLARLCSSACSLTIVMLAWGCGERAPVAEVAPDKVASASPDLPAPTRSTEASVARSSSPPERESLPITHLALGHWRSCATRADGRVVCWGGCLGCDEPTPPVEPTLVAGVTEAIDIAGDDWTGFCVRRKDKTVVCWPAGGRAAPIAGIKDAIDIAPPCALLADGTVWCWRDGAAQQKPGLSGVVGLSRGHGATCARLENGSVSCWGQTATSYLDTSHTMSPTWSGGTDEPARLASIKATLEVDTSSLRGGCARSASGVTCWGGEFRERPRKLTGIEKATQISMGDYHGCALLADATVACWGENGGGQLGVASEKLERSEAAIPVPGVRGIVEIGCGGGEPSGGSGTSCGITTGGDVLCWDGSPVEPLDLSVVRAPGL